MIDISVTLEALVLNFKIREIFLAEVCNLGQFNVFLFRELLLFCAGPEFGSV